MHFLPARHPHSTASCFEQPGRTRGRGGRAPVSSPIPGLLAATLALASACSSTESDTGDGSADAAAQQPGDPGDPGAAAGGSATAEWPSYGKDLANSRANLVETRISVETAGSLVEKWRWDGAGVTSTPALYEGIVYFGDWDGALHAVDAKTGDPLWVTALQPPNPPNQLNDSPFVTDEAVYIGGHGGEIFAVKRATGEMIWDPGIVVDPAGNLMLWSSPVIVDDLFIIGVGSYQVFLSASPPFRGNVVAYDVNTGTERWRRYVTDGQGVSVWSSGAVDRERGLFFIGTGQQYTANPPSPYSDAVVAIRYETGEIAWATQFTENDTWTALGASGGKDWDVGAAPNLFRIGGRDVVGVGEKGGRYYVLDRDTGDIVWQRQLTPGGTTGGVMATAAYAEGVIYVVSNDGTSGGGGFGTSGPSRGTAFALDAASGDILWEHDTGGCFGAVTYANGVVFHPTLDGSIHALRASDGSVLWTQQVGTSVAGGITVSDGMLYVGHGWNWIPLSRVTGGLVAYGLP